MIRSSPTVSAVFETKQSFTFAARDPHRFGKFEYSVCQLAGQHQRKQSRFHVVIKTLTASVVAIISAFSGFQLRQSTVDRGVA